MSKHNIDKLHKPIKSVNLCFDLNDISKVREIREKIMKEHCNNYDQSHYVDEQSPNYPPNQVQLISDKEIDIMKQFATLANPELTLTHFLGTAFISFEYAEMKDFFIKDHA